MTTQLREELDALAETQTFSPDPSAWDRGRRARRRARVGRAAAGLAAVALVVGAGAVTLVPDREAPQPAEVPGGALPSRVDLRDADFGADFETDYAIGRASVALSGNGLLLVDAEDGTYHRFGVVADLVALSPDGYRVAWWSGDGQDPDRIHIADLRTGAVTDWAFNMGGGGQVEALSWRPDSAQLLWRGRDDAGDKIAALIDVTGPSETPDFSGRYGSRGIPSPSRDIIALPSDGAVTAAPFEQIPERGSGRMTGIPVDRALPADLHPDGAVVTPVGWADEDHVVAIIDPPPSDVVERPRLAVLTSPDRPEAEWTYREFLPRLPPEATSFAVDLVPDLTGDPDQELTHDFSAFAAAPDDGPGALPYALGGLAALAAGLAFVRMMQKRA
ncbi:hypothetical protein ASC64_17245 [Nocardioides sp. Root122]|uniref:hypothetical protein n=1 Tax=Nocardioides TaxID=1839 RepID=UPI0007032202|nr:MULTISPECIES: hypothetical protein [Nocardioides]KQV63342.1 hypothetical protein ASC64_17245 [Nocardioides sp. Root122]MCK9825560.1 hypothetical protein [Nocardioides cavernae]